MNKITVIGGGNMGEAIIGGIRKNYSVTVCEKDKSRQDHLRQTYKVNTGEIKTSVPGSDVIILAVKPQDIEEVLKEISPGSGPKILVISIAAGITTAFIEKHLPEKTRVIRTMPNMPAMIGQGITAVARGKHAKQSDQDLASAIFDHLGKTVAVGEDQLDMITAVSGSGPAYVFLLIETMIKAARSMGLNEELAKQLVRSTFLGSVNLLEMKKEDAASLRSKVTSKGGTTEAAIEVFMKSNIEAIFAQALEAAKKRAAELSRS